MTSKIHQIKARNDRIAASWEMYQIQARIEIATRALNCEIVNELDVLFTLDTRSKLTSRPRQHKLARMERRLAIRTEIRAFADEYENFDWDFDHRDPSGAIILGTREDLKAYAATL